MFYNLRRKSALARDRLLYRIDSRSLLAACRAVGVAPGATVCVHSALSRLGYFDGGPAMVVETLMQAVGADGSLLMPSFPTTGTMAGWLDRGEPFDLRTTPSKVGVLTEVFRKTAGVERSLHPTNSVAGWGRAAHDILRDHDKSKTPYGNETPYGRLSVRDDTYVLMFATHVLSLLHHLQERVDFPNFFLPDERDAPFIDAAGRPHVIRTKVMRPKIPYFVAIPAATGEAPDWALIQDFTLTFPKDRYDEIKAIGYRFDGFPVLYRRQAELEAAGMLKTTRLGKSWLGLLHVRPFMQKFELELGEMIDRYRPYYDVDAIAARNLQFT